MFNFKPKLSIIFVVMVVFLAGCVEFDGNLKETSDNSETVIQNDGEIVYVYE